MSVSTPHLDTTASSGHGRFGLAANLERFASLLVAVTLFVVFAATADVFATSNNVRNILEQITILAVVAAGQTVVMLSGGLDLSVGSVVLLSEVVVTDLAVRDGLPIPVALAAALAAGALVGLLNGVLVVVLRIEPILVTLGTLLLAAGVAKLLLGLTYIQIDNPFFDRLATAELPGGVPLMVVIMFACYVVVAVTLYRTAFGKYVYAVGSNRRAAIVAGLPAHVTQILAYVAVQCPGRGGRCAQCSPTRSRQPQRWIGAGVRVDHGCTRRRTERDCGRRRTGRADLGRRRHHRHARQLPDDPRCPAEPPASDDRRGPPARRRGRSSAASGSTVKLAAAARGSADLWVLTVLTVGAFCTFAVINPVWVNRNLVQTMVSQSAALALVAVPLTFSIISRNIDLSVGSVLALQGMVLGRVSESSSLTTAVLAAIGVGVVIGLFHGFLVAKLGLSAIMATLATFIWARGLTLAINDSRPIPVEGWLVEVANKRWAGFTIAAPLVVIAYVVGQWLRSRTKVGLYTAAIGGGPDAARRSGIAIDRYIVGLFVATGVVVGIAAALTVGQLGSASPYIGTELELDAIIAVVIGGTSLAGGYGSVSRTAVGVTFMSVLNSGLLNLGLTDGYYQSARGLVLIGVLSLQILTRRLVVRRHERSDSFTLQGAVSA